MSRVRHGLLAALLLALTTFMTACSTAPQHRHGSFQNNYEPFEPKSLLELLRWKWEAVRQGLPPPPQSPTPRVAPDLAFIHANARAGAAMQPAITWIGHASMLTQMGGLNLLTDPVFSDRASPVSFAGPKRQAPPGVALADLPHIDVVLISHNHYDHLDDASVRALNTQPGGPPLFILPLGHRAWLAARGITSVVELDWWQSHRVGAVEVVLTPTQHWSARGLTDQMHALWGGFAVFAPELHLFFAGDTAYSRDFTNIRQRFAQRQGAQGFDIALLPIGAYEPRWFMRSQHVNPAEAVQIHLDLAAKQSVGVHWGVFELTDEPLDRPPQHLAQAVRAKGLAPEAFGVMAVGETRKLSRRQP